MHVLGKTAETDKPDFTTEASAKTADDNVFAWDHSAKPEFKTIATICEDSDLRVFAKDSETAKPRWAIPVDLCEEPPTECPIDCSSLPDTFNFSGEFSDEWGLYRCAATLTLGGLEGCVWGSSACNLGCGYIWLICETYGDYTGWQIGSGFRDMLIKESNPFDPTGTYVRYCDVYGTPCRSLSGSGVVS